MFHYKNAVGNLDNIKIEINYSMRQHILPVHEVTIDSDYLAAPLTVATLAPIELFGGKIKALTERAAARDLYDVYNMIHERIFDESEMDLLRKCVLFYRAVGSTGAFQEDINLDGIDEITFQMIRQTLIPVLRKDKRFDFEEAKDEVMSYVSELLVPTENEWAFLRNFAKGDYIPELLFEDEAILNRIIDHPMARWKCERIKQTQSQKREQSQGMKMTM